MWSISRRLNYISLFELSCSSMSTKHPVRVRIINWQISYHIIPWSLEYQSFESFKCFDIWLSEWHQTCCHLPSSVITMAAGEGSYCCYKGNNLNCGPKLTFSFIFFLRIMVYLYSFVFSKFFLSVRMSLSKNLKNKIKKEVS